MKRLFVLTISLMLALTAFGGITAFAEESETVYPENEDFIKTLTFTELSDYAVNGAQYAFADGKTVKLYEGGNLSDPYTFGENVTALACKDGTFYCATESGNVYSLPYEDGQESVEYEMPEAVNIINVGDFTYRLSETTLKVADYNNDEIHSFEGDYRNLKQFGESVYAISENAVYSFSGAERTELSLDYADYDSTKSISVGQAATALKTYSSPKIVTVKSGAFMTETDVTTLTEKYFLTDKTVSVKEETSAVLLCTTGNAAIVAIGMDCYILNSGNVEITDENCYTKAEYEYAKITAAGDRLYASPFVSEGTAIMSGAVGLTVKVLNKVEHSVLDTAFYEVQYTAEDGKVTTGYINGKFLIKVEHVNEDNKQPTTVPDPSYSEESNTKTILIIFAVVLLVLAAVGYLAFTATSDKRKNKKDKKANNEPENKS